eukprot:scaffold10647_cov113-Isochrysis_galbana.AAC.8
MSGSGLALAAMEALGEPLWRASALPALLRPAARHLWPQPCDCRRTSSQRCCHRLILTSLNANGACTRGKGHSHTHTSLLTYMLEPVGAHREEACHAVGSVLVGEAKKRVYCLFLGVSIFAR